MSAFQARDAGLVEVLLHVLFFWASFVSRLGLRA